MLNSRARFTVDRVESNVAALISDTDGSTRTVPAGELPQAAGEGSVVVLDDSGRYHLDEEETERRRGRAKSRLERLRERSRRFR